MLTEHGNVQPRPLSSVPASGLPAGVTVEATRLTEALLASAPRASTTSATKILDLVGDVAPRGASPPNQHAARLAIAYLSNTYSTCSCLVPPNAYRTQSHLRKDWSTVDLGSSLPSSRASFLLQAMALPGGGRLQFCVPAPCSWQPGRSPPPLSPSSWHMG